MEPSGFLLKAPSMARSISLAPRCDEQRVCHGARLLTADAEQQTLAMPVQPSVLVASAGSPALPATPERPSRLLLATFWFHFVAILVQKIAILVVPALGTERGPKWVPKIFPKWGPLYKTYTGPHFGLSFGTHFERVLVPKTGYQEFGKNPSPSDPKLNFSVPRMR